ncbi:MAG: hypothetical protein FWH57_07000 [Oscillospiraceae bacterium]|nr:hypothetical protein [Oscillospiraceae bacterium]
MMKQPSKRIIGLILGIFILFSVGVQAASRRSEEDGNTIEDSIAEDSADEYIDISSAINQYSPDEDMAEVAFGEQYAIMLKEDGTVWAMVSNEHSQLGDALRSESMEPVQIAGLSGITMIAAGRDHCLALKDDGSVWAWGDNTDGQLGDGTRESRNIPKQVVGPVGIITIAAKDGISLAYVPGGSLWVWGSNDNGPIGDGITPMRVDPKYSLDDAPINKNMSFPDIGETRSSVRAPSFSKRGPHSTDTKSIHGYVSSMAVDYWGLGSWFLEAHEIVVELRRAFMIPVEAGMSATPVPVANNAWFGEFTIDDVPLGSYVLVIKKPGYLVRTMNVTVADTDPDTIELAPPGIEDNGIFNLWGGDCNDDFRIDNEDPLQVMYYWGCNALDPNYADAAYCDLNMDALIDNEDLMVILAKWESFASQYAGSDEVSFFARNILFSQPDYTIAIPNSGTATKITPATVYDERSRAITNMPITYSLVSPYSGVSIDSETGLVTVASSAYKGDVTIKAEFQNLYTTAALTLTSADTDIELSVSQNSEYLVALTADNISSFSGSGITVTYDTAKLQLLNIAEQVYGVYTSVGTIPGTDITVTTATPGSFTLALDKPIAPGKAWKGAITVLKFKAIATGTTTISATG